MKVFTQEEYEELMKYVDLEGSEVGDYLTDLVRIWETPESYGKRKALSNAVDAELRHWLKRFRKEAKIVTCTEPQPDKAYKELEWN